MNTSSEKSLFRCRNVELVRHNHVVLRDLSLTLYSGEVLCVYGTHDSGKTTLFDLLRSEIDVSCGRVEYNGKNSKGRKLDTVLIDSKTSLCSGLRVWEFFIGFLPLRFRLILNKKKCTKLVKMIFDDFNVDVDPASFVSDLNSFEVLLLEILMARLMRPDVILIDDILYYTEPGEILLLRSLFDRIVSNGTSVVISGCRFSSLMLYASRIAVLGDGMLQGVVLPHEYELFQKLNRFYTDNDIISSGTGGKSGTEVLSYFFKEREITLCKGACVVVADPAKLLIPSFRKTLQNDETAGRLVVKGREIHSLDDRIFLKNVVYISHDMAGYVVASLSPADNIALGASSRFSFLSVQNRNVMDFISNDYEKWWGQKSGFMEKSNCEHLTVEDAVKLILYRIYLMKPEIVIFDSVMNAMDQRLQFLFSKALKKYVEDGFAVLVMEANRDFLSPLSSDVIHIGSNV